MGQNFTKYAFTETVKNIQEESGSRKSYSRMEKGEQYKLSERETSFIETRDQFYMSTIGENGWPYLQFRGGPPGFLKAVDRENIAFADFRGNMQYISTGNIVATKKAVLFLIDYPTKQRLKIWAEASVIRPEDDPELMSQLEDKEYPAIVERAFSFKIVGFDWNCPQHITERFSVKEIEALVERGGLQL